MQAERNIYRTADGGQSWDTVYDGWTFDPPLSFLLNNDDVYVLTLTGNFLKNTQFVTTVPQNGYLYTDGTGHLYLSTSSHTFQSRNDGLDWDTLFVNSSPLLSYSIDKKKLVFDSSGTLYSVLPDGIDTSADHGDTWTRITEFNTRRFATFGFAADSILYGNDLFSRDDGFTWDTLDFTGLNSHLLPVWGKNGDLMTIVKDSAKKQYFATKLLLEDPWSSSSLLPRQDIVNPYFLFGRFPTNELWAINYDGLLSVIDNGGTWHNTHVAGHPSSDIFIAEAIDPQTIIASGPHRIYRSSNRGFSFTEVAQLTSGDVAKTIVSNGTVVHVLTVSSIDHYSTDQGTTWTTFVLPKDEEVTDLAVAGNGALYASTTAGVFRNPSGFNNPFVWEDISGILKGVHLEHVAVRDNKRLYVATTTGNVYFTDLPGSSVAQPEAPRDALHIYPNPATDRCSISGIGESVEVELYNLLGIRVLQAPYHGQLDVSNVPAGVYQIVVDNFRASLVIHR